MTTLEDLPAHKLVEELRHRRIDARSARYPPHRCEDCPAIAQHYMVNADVWSLAWPSYAAESTRRKREWREHGTGKLFCLLCFACLEKRLLRKLTVRDFDFTIPINQPILFGLSLSVAQ